MYFVHLSDPAVQNKISQKDVIHFKYCQVNEQDVCGFERGLRIAQKFISELPDP